LNFEIGLIHLHKDLKLGVHLRNIHGQDNQTEIFLVPTARCVDSVYLLYRKRFSDVKNFQRIHHN